MDREAIFAYVLGKYGTKPEYLWLQYPSYAVFRNAGTGKWYGLVMDVPKDKLGLPGTDVVDILDVKCPPMVVDLLRNKPGFLPAYHMSKRSWISVLLDGTVPDQTIQDLLDQSFSQTEQKKSLIKAA